MQSLSALNETLAAPGDSGAAIGFTLAAATQVAGGADRSATILWVRHEAAIAEAGTIFGPGLSAFGIAPSRLVFAHLRTLRDVLRAGLEGARCPALGVVIIETTEVVDFTASRRLKLAAVQSGVPVLLIRHGNASAPTAASIRWQVRSARSNTGAPAFDVTVLKHPKTFPGQRHVIEWDIVQRTFVETLPEPVVALSGRRSLAA
jgi:protein ImuA